MRARRMLAAAMAVGLALAACGGDDSGGGDDDESTTTTEAEETTTTTESEETTTTESEDTTTTTEADDVPEEDVELIVELWDEHNDAWTTPEDGFAYVIEHNFPGSDVNTTPEQYRACLDGNGAEPFTFWSEFVVLDPDTIEPDPDFVIPFGPLEGQTPEGDTYVMEIDLTITTDFPGELRQGRLDVHATVLDGEAFYFIPCIPA